ncbi:MAG: hypothetical protein LZF60_250132 [Nitrospira sp.]|nr:hypothetical protein [Nitrospira sp.]ULA60552.1 MAG: hypothetical protein LZF60_250132 [Nitrospira sp.]
MRQLILSGVLGFVLLTTGGCSYLFYPHAKEFTEKAKGGNTVETLINLTNMMEASAKAGQQGKGKDQAFDDLHNQLHAFDHTICCVEKNTRDLPAYDLVVTHNKELWAIFKRVWKFKDDQPQRSQHLELFATEVRETRDSLHALK